MKPCIGFLGAILFVMMWIGCTDSPTSSGGRNHAPNVPSNPFPANGATNQDADTVYFYWTCTDPDDDELTHGIAVASDAGLNNIVGAATSLSTPSAFITSLDYSTTYYWMVWASDGEDTTVGPVWSFATMAPPTLFLESFEIHTVPGTYWYATDQDAVSGLDYWGDQSSASGARVFGGNYSAYCADYGDGVGQLYDNDMLAGMEFENPVDITGQSSVQLTFMMYYDTEPNFDYVTLQYWNGSSYTTFASFTGFAGWTQYTYNLIGFPSQLYLVWVFDSDGSIVDEGAYVDDISLTGMSTAVSFAVERRSQSGQNVVFVPGTGAGQDRTYERVHRVSSKNVGRSE